MARQAAHAAGAREDRRRPDPRRRAAPDVGALVPLLREKIWHPPRRRRDARDAGRAHRVAVGRGGAVIRRLAAASFAALLSAAACSRPATSPGAAPASAAPAATPSGPRVVLPSGAAVAVEVAITDQERAQGLMFRESMPKDAGMVFLFDGLEITPFWMKHCPLPLDMIYATKDGTIVD